MKLKLGSSRTGAVIPLLWLNLFVTLALHGKTVAAFLVGIVCGFSFTALFRQCWEEPNKEDAKP